MRLTFCSDLVPVAVARVVQNLIIISVVGKVRLAECLSLNKIRNVVGVWGILLMEAIPGTTISQHRLCIK